MLRLLSARSASSTVLGLVSFFLPQVAVSTRQVRCCNRSGAWAFVLFQYLRLSCQRRACSLEPDRRNQPCCLLPRSIGRPDIVLATLLLSAPRRSGLDNANTFAFSLLLLSLIFTLSFLLLHLYGVQYCLLFSLPISQVPPSAPWDRSHRPFGAAATNKQHATPTGDRTGQQPQQTTPHDDDEAERPNGRLLRACKVAPTTVVTPSHRTNRVRPGQLTVPDIWPKARSSSLASSAAAAQATTQQQKAFRHYYHHVQYSVLFLSSAHPGHFLLISDIARPFSFSTSFDPTPPPTSSPTPPPPSASPTHTNRPSHPLRQATPPSTPAATGNQTAGSPWRHLSYKISHRITIAIASRTCRHFIYLLLIPRCSARQSG